MDTFLLIITLLIIIVFLMIFINTKTGLFGRFLGIDLIKPYGFFEALKDVLIGSRGLFKSRRYVAAKEAKREILFERGLYKQQVPNHLRHSDHEFDFKCEMCGSLSGDFISENYYKKGPGILFRVISFLTFMIPSYIEDREEETLWREEMFVCNECDWTQK